MAFFPSDVSDYTAGRVQWDANDNGSGIYVNTGSNAYVSKTDNGYYLVRFVYGASNDDASRKVIAVRSGAEVLLEAQKAISGTTASTDISTLKTHVTGYITADTAGTATIPLEDTLDLQN